MRNNQSWITKLSGIREGKLVSILTAYDCKWSYLCRQTFIYVLVMTDQRTVLDK